MLGRRGGGRWRRSLGFEDPMHLLVRAVVLRMGRTDILDLDAKAQPPHAQRRQAQGSAAAERGAVVHPDHARQTASAKQTDQHSTHRGITGRRHVSDQQYLPAVKIPHGQRINPRAIAGAKPTLEIDRPNVVGPAGQRADQSRQLWPRSADPANLPGRPPLQSSYMWPNPSRPMLPQQPAQLFGSPIRLRPAHLRDGGSVPRRPASSQPVRPPGSRLQTQPTLLLETTPPLIASLPTDPML